MVSMYPSYGSACSPLGTRPRCDVESTSLTLIESRNNVACPVSVSNGYRVLFTSFQSGVTCNYLCFVCYYALLWRVSGIMWFLHADITIAGNASE